jgi:hypothetical protein
MPATAEFDQLNNPYRSSHYSAAEETLGGDGEAQVAELQAFVGRKANYYLRKWAPRLESPQGDVGFNWAAFFLTAFWLGYRKMFRNVIVYFFATIGLSVFVELLFVFVFKSPAMPASVNLLMNVMVAVVCGGFGNTWYLAHARRKIAAARAQGFEGDQLLSAIADRGGTSLLCSIGLVFAAGFVLLAVGIVLGIVLAIARSAGV